MTNKLIRLTIRSIFRFLFRVLTRLEVQDRHTLAGEGGYILASNHLDLIDAPLIFMLLEREDATALVAKKHQKNPFLRLLINAVGGIWLNREEADARALRAARTHLQGGGVLGIAPEGTRSTTGALIPAKTGIAYLAAFADVPIVPIGIWGTESGLKRAFTLKRPKIHVLFGKPFNLPPLDRRARDESLKYNTDIIMSRIAALLPPEYRGVYADHPRLKELIESGGT
jgi:1-acyl-sn-glycerol-3-phosphate acyltransferase